MSDGDDNPRETENGPSKEVERGILTDEDENYLKGEKQEELSTSGESRRKKSIRERVGEAIIDFELLFDELPEEEYERIFEYIHEERGVDPHDMISHMIAFMYVGWNKWFMTPEDFIDYRKVWKMTMFQRSMAEGIRIGKSYPDFDNEDSEVYISSTSFLFEPPEERAIAEALSGTDIWREENERLLEKKKMSPDSDIPVDADIEEIKDRGKSPEKLADWIIWDKYELYDQLVGQDPSDWPLGSEPRTDSIYLTGGTE